MGKKFKARFAAKGYSQIENVNYTETFSPTARITSVSMLVQLAVENQLYYSSNGCQNGIFECRDRL